MAGNQQQSDESDATLTPMLTRWGKTLDADRVLEEYPRPQMVRKRWQNLNGLWRYAITPRTAPEPSCWDGDILVPFCVESPLSGVGRNLTASDRLWYQQTFSINSYDNRKSTLLHFGAVDYDCTVWLNDGLAGSHTGGFDPFSLDISDFVTDGDNRLVVAVSDPTSAGDQPRGKQHNKPQGIWYSAVSGIWQTVWLEQVPATSYIEEVLFTPAADCTAIHANIFLQRPSRNPQLAVRLKVSLRGVPVAELIGRPDRTIEVPIPDPQRWSPAQPTLYEIDVALIQVKEILPNNNTNDKNPLLREIPLRGATEARLFANTEAASDEPIDRVASYFALRSISVGPHPDTGMPALLLNNQALFHHGTLDQGWWPDGFHTPPADAAMIYELEFLKAAGFNSVRKHIKVEPARYYYHCDRLGLMVWQDMPSGFVPAQFVTPNDESEGLRHSRSSSQFALELERMIRALRVHPSIVIWVLHNEGWGQFDSTALTQRIQQLDPDRLVNANSGWLDMGTGDLIDRHDYQPDPVGPDADSTRARVIGEYGGIAHAIDGHVWNPDTRNWGYQDSATALHLQSAYQRLTAAIVDAMQHHGLSAAIYTQTTDVEGEINGLISYDRAVEKLSRAWLAELHAQLHADP